jgi:hypothetical protein
LCAISVVLVLSPSSLMLLLAPVAADFDAIVMDGFWPKYVGNGCWVDDSKRAQSRRWRWKRQKENKIDCCFSVNFGPSLTAMQMNLQT